jgi:predicted nucleic acid-binding protein
MILLDTNVLSELTRRMPDRGVERWLADQRVADVFISAITEAELRYGVALLAPGKQQFLLAAATEDMLANDFVGRILPFDSPAAIAYADIAAHRRRAGRPMSQSDAQIAVIAQSRGATLATRNVRDFEGCGVTVVNPWIEAGRD